MMNSKTSRLLQYTGNPSQVFYAQRMTMREGRADGTDVIEVGNGKMMLWVMPGRCLDIGRLSYGGVNFSFLSKAGFSNGAYCGHFGMEGLSTFAPGFLTTCGLANSGLPNTVDSEEFGFHGRIGQTPAEEISVIRDIRAEEPVIKIAGWVREGRLFGRSLALKREFTFYFDKPYFDIKDTIYNETPKDEHFMLLYHFNFGYPLLDENTRFITTHAYDHPVDENAKREEPNRKVFYKPGCGIPENCFYYKQHRAQNGEAFAALVNEPLGLGAVIRTNPEELPLLCQWKSWSMGDYVSGIEPCNCQGDGRKAHIDRGEVEIIPAYGQKSVSIRVEITDNGKVAELERNTR